MTKPVTDDVAIREAQEGSNGDRPPAVSHLAELGKDHTESELLLALRCWAATLQFEGGDGVEVGVQRETAIKTLAAKGIRAPARIVDAALATVRGQQLEEAPPAEPWPTPVDGAELLEEIRQAFLRYVALPAGASIALALWSLLSWAFDAVPISPRLGITSPTPRCGKTTLLELLLALCRRPLLAASLTTAVVFRVIARDRPTLLIDEADTFLSEMEDLRGILNSGHRRGGSVLRCVGDEHEPQAFDVYAPVAIATIGRLPTTLADRSVEIRMRRRLPGERVERLRVDRIADELQIQRRKCERWAADNRDELTELDPDVPKTLHDRAADNWRPLLAVADLAGGDWPDRAREAIRELSGDEEDTSSAGEILLADLRRLYDERQAGRLSSTEIVEALTELEERPWPEWRRGKPITARGVARLLEPYGIRPRQVWLAGGNVRGYERCHLEEAWERYLGSARDAEDTPSPADPPSTSARSARTPVALGIAADSQVLGNDDPSGSKNAANARGSRTLADLAVGDPPLGQEGVSRGGASADETSAQLTLGEVLL